MGDDAGEIDPIVVGFEGTTDDRGAVSALRVLVMEKRWVDKEPGCFGNLIYKISEMLKPKNIADVTKRTKAAPIDIVDKFWRYKYEEQNH